MDTVGIGSAVIGAGIATFGVVLYVIGIMRRGTKPRMASWIAWGTGNAIFTIAAFQEHSYVGAAIDLVAALANLLVIIASFHKKVAGKPNDIIDWACLASSLACIAVMVLAPDDMLLGAFMGMLANATATIPTLRHAWMKPREETWQLFIANAASGVISLGGILIMDGFMIETTAGPLMTIFGSSSLVAIILLRRRFTRAEVMSLVTETKSDNEVDVPKLGLVE